MNYSIILFEEEARVVRRDKLPHADHNGNLLLVEDDEINELVARELLKGFGYTVDAACNGQEALEMIQKSEGPSKYDLVLMDLQMPVMSGVQATREIRKLKGYDKLPIIALTADGKESLNDECREAGMNDVVRKPIDPHRMFETIGKWLRRNEETSLLVVEDDQRRDEIPALDGIDTRDGLAHMEGNTKLYQDLLLRFLASNEHFVQQVKKKFNGGEAEDGRRMVHTLKGVSGSLGMVELRKRCMELEDKIHEGIADDFSIVIEPVAAELHKVLKSIQENISKKATAAVEFLADSVMPQLEALEKLITEQDPEAINLMDQIGVISGLEMQLEKLRQALAGYDFDCGMKRLKELKSQIEII